MCRGTIRFPFSFLEQHHISNDKCLTVTCSGEKHQTLFEDEDDVIGLMHIVRPLLTERRLTSARRHYMHLRTHVHTWHDEDDEATSHQTIAMVILGRRMFGFSVSQA
ncbi:hypothetical protein MPSEU_000509200 [Mayamaea pseudoterrestris]|nr:hypothetical protein MPSEU_000509200 [Mayamaea pseudoterrestris]